MEISPKRGQQAWARHFRWFYRRFSLTGSTIWLAAVTQCFTRRIGLSHREWPLVDHKIVCANNIEQHGPR